MNIKIFVAALLTCLLLVPFVSVSVSADGTILPEDDLSIIISEIEKYPSNYAGIYFNSNDSKYHIAAKDTEKILNILKSDKLTKHYSAISAQTVIDKVEYSWEELTAVADRVVKNLEKLQAHSANVDVKLNGITVSSEKWTEENRKRALELCAEAINTYTGTKGKDFKNITFVTEEDMPPPPTTSGRAETPEQTTTIENNTSGNINDNPGTGL